MDSYGYIETYGYVTSIVAADEALKAADVTLKNIYFVKGGIVTIELAGDVAAVNAAIEVGVECAKKLGYYLSSNVIARVDNETKKILVNKTKKDETEKKEKTTLVEEKSQEEPIFENIDKDIEKIENIENLETNENINIEIENSEEVEIDEIQKKDEEIVEIFEDNIQEESSQQDEIQQENVQENQEVLEVETIQENNNEIIEQLEQFEQIEEENQDEEEKQSDDNNEIVAIEEHNEYSEEKEAIKKLRRKYQDMRVIELKTKVNNLKTEHTWNQIKAMTKKKLIEILIKHNQEE